MKVKSVKNTFRKIKDAWATLWSDYDQFDEALRLMDGIDKRIKAREVMLRGGDPLYDDARCEWKLVGESDTGYWLKSGDNKVQHSIREELLDLHVLVTTGGRESVRRTQGMRRGRDRGEDGKLK